MFYSLVSVAVIVDPVFEKCFTAFYQDRHFIMDISS